MAGRPAPETHHDEDRKLDRRPCGYSLGSPDHSERENKRDHQHECDER